MSSAFFFPNPGRLATGASLLFWMTSAWVVPVRIAKAQSTQELLWSEEFNQPGEPDASVWNIRTGGGGWGNGELQVYDASAVTVSEDGALLITASRNPDNSNDEFVSGRVDTAGKLQAQYGTFKARIQIQDSINAGLWPAFWTLGSDFATVEWPRSGGTYDSNNEQ
jgi:beta-glucanase (GH16 family)